jgi:hypothetical protein
MTEPLIRPLRTSTPSRTDRSIDDQYPNSSNHTHAEQERESPPSTPRWVKLFAIVAIVLLLLFAGLHLTGNAPMHSMSPSGTEHGVQAP